MIRKSLKRRIYECLNDDYFVTTDFSVIDLSGKGEPDVRIQYLDSEYVFEIGIYSEGYSCLLRPAEASVSEAWQANSLDEVFGFIQNWKRFLREDLIADPILRQIEKHESALKEIFRRLDEAADEEFRPEEMESLHVRLDELQSRMEQQLSAATTDNVVLKEQLEKLKGQFERLSSVVDQGNRKGFFRRLFGQAAEWMKDPQNRQLLRDGASMATQLIEDQIKK
jgi:hypothetical protein